AYLAETDQEPKIDDEILLSDPVFLGKRIVERRKLSIPAPTNDPVSIETFFVQLATTLAQNPRTQWEKQFESSYDVSNREACGDSFRVLVRAGESESKAKKTAQLFYQKRGLTSPVLTTPSKVEVKATREFNPENGVEFTPPRPFNLMFQTRVGASS